MSLAAEDKARLTPELPALVDARLTITWSQLDRLVNRSANAMVEANLGERRVAVFARNSAEIVLVLLASLHAGVSAVPVSAQLTAQELHYILDDAMVGMVFAGPENVETALEAVAIANHPVTTIAWRSAKVGTVIGWEDWIAAASGAPPPTGMVPRKYLQYTSGTTGKPKAIEAVDATLPAAGTVAELIAKLQQSPAFPDIGPHLVVGPLHHNAPLSSVRALAAGIPVVVLDRFQPEDVLQAIEQFGIASSIMVPTHFQRLLALPAEIRCRHDISTLRMVAHTGSACPVPVKRAMIDWFGPVLFEAYGGTESGTTNMITSEEWLAHPGSVGRTIESFELEVIGEHGEHLGPREIGQLYFKDKSGRGIVYKDDAEKTRMAHRKPGVFTLGDVGYYDEDGYVFITDRVSDMIVSGGVNIYPAEIEQVLLLHPHVGDIAVIGVPNADLGEEVKALIVPREGALPSPADLADHCRRHLAGYKCPKSFDIVADIGRNALGKVNKRALRAPFWPTDRTIG